MTRQRGNMDLWAALGILVFIGLIAFGIYKAITSYGDDRFDAGQVLERSKWELRESQELAASNAKILELEQKVRALEKKNTDDVAAAAAKHHKELERVEAEKAAAIADANRFRLRWTAKCPVSQGSSGGAGTQAGSDPAGGGQTATCELPGEIRQSLIELASDADKVVSERNTLLEVAQKDREVCK